MDLGQQNNDQTDQNNIQSSVGLPAQTPQLPQIQSNNLPQTPQPGISISSSSISKPISSDSPSVAEDVDLIEKEWVNKAKKIVDSTRNDPSQQNIQLNKIKADYLKIRFNKDIKPMDG